MIFKHYEVFKTPTGMLLLKGHKFEYVNVIDQLLVYVKYEKYFIVIHYFRDDRIISQ